MTHRALIVAIVSGPSQATADKVSIPTQLADCHAVCERHGWEVVSEVVIPGHSRNYDDLTKLVADCPEYGLIMRAITDNTITLLVAWAYDRLWRTVSLMAHVTSICRQHRVQVYSLHQSSEPTLDGSTPFFTRASETIFSLFAEQENDARNSRVCSGKKGVIFKGGVQYNDRPPYGYLKAGRQSIAPNPVTAPVVVVIFDLRVNQRLGFHAIARELNRRMIPSPMGGIWKHKAIIDIIRNTIYKGETHWGDARCEHGRHTPLVSREIWEAAQINQMVYRNTGPFPRPLAGLCRCGYCGYAMAYERPQPQKSKQLRCGHYLSGGQCQPNSVRADIVEDFARLEITKVLSDPAAFLASSESDVRRDEIGARLNQIDVELSSLEDRKRRAYAAYESKVIPLEEYAGRRKGLDARILELEQQKRALSSQDYALSRLTTNLQTYSSRVNDLATMPADELHGIYLSLIREIIVTRGQSPVIHWL
jgi:DNA invertase Pin-like site-specific DNA recombinase